MFLAKEILNNETVRKSMGTETFDKDDSSAVCLSITIMLQTQKKYSDRKSFLLLPPHCLDI